MSTRAISTRPTATVRRWTEGDIEFPELTWLLTLAGSEVIFVPFSTDERSS
ncbi:MAG: hypothetical protein OEZ06_27295 [Myxococcales bacterium]|nr:hypothetical protein [Myxococcales bacterium]